MSSLGRTFDIIAPQQLVTVETASEPEQNIDMPQLEQIDAEIAELEKKYGPAPYGPSGPHPDDMSEHRKSRKKKFIAVLAIIVILSIGLGAVAYRTPWSLSSVYLGDEIVDPTASQNQLLKQLDAAQSSYRFAIAYPDKTTKIFAMTDAGITIDGKASINKLQTGLQHSGFRKYIWWRPMRYVLATKTDSQKLNDFIKTSAQSANAPAVDAALSITNGQTVITDAKNGYGYSIPGGQTFLVQNIARLKAARLSLTPQTIYPDIQAKDLASAKDKADAYMAKSVTFTVDSVQVPATKADIGTWLDVSPVPSAHTDDITVNSGKVLAYINKLSARYVKPPVSEITTTDAAGAKSVLIPGADGIDVTNKDDAAKAATSALEGSKPATISLTVNHVAHSTVNAGDYDKWIVVDLTTKRMYAYEHTNLVRTFLVSAGAPKTPTVVGQYHIYAKYASQDMRGSNADGSRYFQPHVRYVNYFYQDYAIHGNYWRPASYFGNINSSHGCVGITDSDAEWLYGWAPLGTTVITHN